MFNVYFYYLLSTYYNSETRLLLNNVNRYARASLTETISKPIPIRRTLLRRSRVNVRYRRCFAKKNYAVASVLVVRTVHNLNRLRYDTGCIILRVY